MINKIYLSEKTISKVREELRKKTFVLLDDFFDENFYFLLKSEILRKKFSKKKIPDQYSFSGAENCRKFEKIFLSPQFLEFLEETFDLKIKKIEFSMRKFQRGDYTLLHDSEKSNDGKEFIFFISDFWDAGFGGNVFYLGKKPLIVQPRGNRLFVIRRNKSRRFVKYLNSRCDKKSFVLVQGRINAPARI